MTIAIEPPLTPGTVMVAPITRPLMKVFPFFSILYDPLFASDTFALPEHNLLFMGFYGKLQDFIHQTYEPHAYPLYCLLTQAEPSLLVQTSL